MNEPNHSLQQFPSDASSKAPMGRSGGETFQMIFRGDGFVAIQPFEEIPVVNGQARP